MASAPSNRPASASGNCSGIEWPKSSKIQSRPPRCDKRRRLRSSHRLLRETELDPLPDELERRVDIRERYDPSQDHGMHLELSCCSIREFPGGQHVPSCKASRRPAWREKSDRCDSSEVGFASPTAYHHIVGTFFRSPSTAGVRYCGCADIVALPQSRPRPAVYDAGKQGNRQLSPANHRLLTDAPVCLLKYPQNISASS